MADTLYVEINYQNGNTVVIESVGPHSAVGFVKDAVFGHFTETNGEPINDIRVGTKIIPGGPRIMPRVDLQ